MKNARYNNKIIKIKQRIYEIIFEADTKAGKLFDLSILLIILLSIFLVILESISSIRLQYGHILRVLEWGITVVFTLEYLARIWVTEKPLNTSSAFTALLICLPCCLLILMFSLLAGTT